MGCSSKYAPQCLLIRLFFLLPAACSLRMIEVSALAFCSVSVKNILSSRKNFNLFYLPKL